MQSIDQAKTGLQATLIIRHPDDGKLYVNLDQEILQLIREARCLDRMGLEIPESAKIALFQVSDCCLARCGWGGARFAPCLEWQDIRLRYSESSHGLIAAACSAGVDPCRSPWLQQFAAVSANAHCGRSHSGVRISEYMQSIRL